MVPNLLQTKSHYQVYYIFWSHSHKYLIVFVLSSVLFYISFFLSFSFFLIPFYLWFRGNFCISLKHIVRTGSGTCHRGWEPLHYKMKIQEIEWFCKIQKIRNSYHWIKLRWCNRSRAKFHFISWLNRLLIKFFDPI